MRFEFGKNWKRFLRKAYSEKRQEISRNSVLELLSPYSLEGSSFLDIGSGSGIHSLSALELGCSRVVSFDYDRDSVEATNSLKSLVSNRHYDWKIEQGSILDDSFIKKLGVFDLVYSWGVLHHTGNLYTALKNSASLVQENGLLVLALYDNIQYKEHPEYWINLKIKYLQSGFLGKRLKELDYILTQQGSLIKLIQTVWSYKKYRGMSYYTDVVDWLGGFPMEFCSIYDIIPFFYKRGFQVVKVITGQGNTEYVFKKSNKNNSIDTEGKYKVFSSVNINWEVLTLRFPFELAQLPKERPIFIFGSTKYAIRLYNLLLKEGLTVFGFIETNPKSEFGFNNVKIIRSDNPKLLDDQIIILLAVSRYVDVSLQLFVMGRKTFYNAFPLVRNI